MLVEAASASRNVSAVKAGHDETAAENGDSAPENKNTLADRIRALQSTASRVASTN
jgi:hypothetical protein